MICLVQEGNLPAFLQATSLDAILGARLYTQYQVYGLEYPAMNFWLQQNENGEATAALSRFDGWLTVSAGERADLDELAEFARMLGGFSRLEAAPALCECLRGDGKLDGGLMFCYKGEGFGGMHPGVHTQPALRDVYQTICAANTWFSDTTNWAGWYTHTSHLLRHRLGFCSAVQKDGKVVSTGGVYTMGQCVAVIGGLATLPGYRGRGYAAQILHQLVDVALQQGKTPALFCAEESLVGYYSRNGFVPAGRWAEVQFAAPKTQYAEQGEAP